MGYIYSLGCDGDSGMWKREDIFGSGWRSQTLEKRDEEMGTLGREQLGLPLQPPLSE